MNRIVLRPLLFLLCAIYAVQAVSAASMPGTGVAPGLDEISMLARNGAPILALRLLEQQQPSLKQSPGAWMQWERERIQLYQSSSNWPAIIERMERLHDDARLADSVQLPDSFMRWAMEQQAGAHLRLGELEQTLALLRSLLWGNVETTVAGNGDKDAVPRWRMLVIQAYLEAGRIEDAYTAMLRYRQDYADKQSQWELLYARILMQAGRAQEVEQLLGKQASGEARILLYQAQLEDGSVSADEMRKKLTSMKSLEGAGREDEVRMWALAARQAQRQGDTEAGIEYLVRALSIETNYSLSAKSRMGARGGDLWQAYYRYGKQLGNELQLLSGNHPAWLVKARQLQEREPIKAASLYAVLLQETDDIAIRAEAHREFAQLLVREKHGFVLLQHLYLDQEGGEGHIHVQASALPDEIRHQLVDDALTRADIPLASRLMGDMEHAPPGSDVFQWKLRRARILIMGGKQLQGIEALDALLNQAQGLARQQADRLVQVLFDLQSAERHKETVDLFARLLVMVPTEAGKSSGEREKYRDSDARWRREIYYWMADSYKAMKRYQEAARLYLRSAMWLGEATMDPWAQTARYQAADVLASAGLREDAAALYRTLLKVTQDKDRRTVLQSRLQQLWLKPPRQDAAATAERRASDPARQGFQLEGEVW